MLNDSILSPLTASDGENIAVQDWPLPDARQGAAPRGLVLLVHGLGEHAARYARLTADLNQWGFVVRGYDQYGHGDSSGVQGALPYSMRLMDDLADVIDDARRMMSERYGLLQCPLILLGHSMGGVVAAGFVRQRIRAVEGLILSSPALDPGLSAFQKWMLRSLPRFAQHLRVDNGLKRQYLSRNPDVVTAYERDPRVHRWISARLAQFIAQEGQRCVDAAPEWTLATLLVYAGSDRLVSPAGSRAFAAAASPGVVQAHEFLPMYHEMFEDPERDQVLAVIRQWLDTRFATSGANDLMHKL